MGTSLPALLSLLLLGLCDRAASGGSQRSLASLTVLKADPSAPSATNAVASQQAAPHEASKPPANESVQDIAQKTLAAPVEAKIALLHENVSNAEQQTKKKAAPFPRTYTVFSLSAQEAEATMKANKANSILQKASPVYEKHTISAVYEPMHIIFSSKAQPSPDANTAVLEEVTADGDMAPVSNPLKVSQAAKASMIRAVTKPDVIVLEPEAKIKVPVKDPVQMHSLPLKTASPAGSLQVPDASSVTLPAQAGAAATTLAPDAGQVNSTPVVGVDAAGAQAANSTYQTTVVSSWVLVGMMGNFGVPLADSEKPWIVRGIRDAVADSLEVCRSSVTLVDVRGLNVVPFSTLPSSGPTTVNPTAAIRTDDSTLGSSIGALQVLKSMLSRRSAIKAKNHGRDPFDSMNITRIRATYEVRIFPAMRATVPQVARRIDLLQSYSRFNDLSRMVATTLAASAGPVKGDSISVVLDDLGYGSVHYLDRGDMNSDELEDCIEEGRLYDARNVHKYVVGLSMILIIMTTCAGSSVFAMKQPNIVPSRINPLMGPSG